MERQLSRLHTKRKFFGISMLLWMLVITTWASAVDGLSINWLQPGGNSEISTHWQMAIRYNFDDQEFISDDYYIPQLLFRVRYQILNEETIKTANFTKTAHTEQPVAIKDTPLYKYKIRPFGGSGVISAVSGGVITPETKGFGAPVHAWGEFVDGSGEVVITTKKVLYTPRPRISLTHTNVKEGRAIKFIAEISDVYGWDGSQNLKIAIHKQGPSLTPSIVEIPIKLSSTPKSYEALFIPPVENVDEGYYAKVVAENTSSQYVATSQAVRAVGYNLNFSHDRIANGKVRLTWEPTEGALGLKEFKVTRKLYGSADNEDVLLHKTPDVTYWIDEDNRAIPGARYDYRLYAYTDSANREPIMLGASTGSTPNGVISGTILGESTGGIEVRLDVLTPEISPTPINEIKKTVQQSVITTTDLTGNYFFTDLYYGKEADFKITPLSTGSGGFEPVDKAVALIHINNTSASDIDFKDNTVADVPFQVVQIHNNIPYPVEGVTLFSDTVGNTENKNSAITDIDGICIQSRIIGDYEIYPDRNSSHSYSPEKFDVSFIRDSVYSNFIFEDISKNDLTVSFGGPCESYITDVHVKIYTDSINGQVVDSIWTIDNGSLSTNTITLPARKYAIKIESYRAESVDEDVIEQTQKWIGVDLTEGPVHETIIYGPTPKIIVTGITPFHKVGYDGIYDSVLIVDAEESLGPRTLTIALYEDIDEDCPILTGDAVFTISHDFDGVRKDTIINVTSGSFQYTFEPRAPRVDNNHLYELAIAGEWGGKTDIYYETSVLMTGSISDGKTITTKSPEIPFLILRDPQGDNSYASYSTSLSSSSNISIGYTSTSGFNEKLEATVSAKVGAKVLGQGAEATLTGGVSGSVGLTSSTANESQFTMTTETTQGYQTSSDAGFIGRDGDVYAGAAINFEYGTVKKYSFDYSNPQVVIEEKLLMAPSGFGTTFIFTDKYIRGSLIPSLNSMIEIYSNNGEIRKALETTHQRAAWENVLQQNDDAKAKSVARKNVTFSGGTPINESITTTLSSSRSATFSMIIDKEFSHYMALGLEGGVPGLELSGEVSSTFTMNWSDEKTTSTGTGEAASKTIAYVINDNDASDHISIDICDDPIYGTPVFKLVGGSTSQPHETGTLQIEKCAIATDSYVKNLTSDDDVATFTFTLNNITEEQGSTTAVPFKLSLLPGSNHNGAEVKMVGSPVTFQGIVYDIIPGKPEKVQVTVKKGDSQHDEFQNLTFRLESNNDGAIYQDVAVSVYYSSSCSDMNISSPGDNWIKNGNGTNELPIVLDGYDKTKVGVVTLQYAALGNEHWQDGKIISGSILGEESTSEIITLDEYLYQSETVALDDNGKPFIQMGEPELSPLRDGPFMIRAKVKHGDVVRYSNVISGIVDRTAPKCFGLPQPSDKTLSLGDEVSVTFDELINSTTLSNSDVVVTKADGTIIPAVLGSYENKITVNIDPEGLDLVDELITVTLSPVQDLYGNYSEVITWKFTVPSAENLVTSYSGIYISGSYGKLESSSESGAIIRQSITGMGNSEAVEAIPSPSYEFIGWSDGRTDNPRIDENVTTNISVTANFSKPVAIINEGKVSDRQRVNGMVIADNPVSIEAEKVTILLDTKVPYAVVHFMIYDLLGNRVDEQVTSLSSDGTYQFYWDMRNKYGTLVGSGSYKAVAVVTDTNGKRTIHSEMIGIQK